MRSLELGAGDRHLERLREGRTQVTKYLDCAGSQSAEGPEWRKAYGDTLLNSSLSLPAQKGSRQPVAHEDRHDEREVPNDGTHISDLHISDLPVSGLSRSLASSYTSSP